MRVSSSFNVPTVRLRTLYPLLKEIFNTYAERDFTKEELRNTLKINPKSSGLSQKILDFKAFGLLEETNEKLRITNSGKMLSVAKDNEKLTALLNVVRIVPLWNLLYEQYNNKIEPENFWNILSRLTQLDAESAKQKSDKILKAYFDDLNYALTGVAIQTPTIKRTRKPKTQQSYLLPQITLDKSVSHKEEGFGYDLYSGYGDFSITIDNELTWNIAKVAFDEIFKAIKVELENRMKKTN